MIAIVNYEAGNLTSVSRALSHLGLTSKITDNHAEILKADRVIFPGVGAAGKAMQVIREKGLDEVLEEVVSKGTPFLGICLGTQVILDESEEGNTKCLGLIRGKAKRFPLMGLKIPHMGWNNIELTREHPVFKDINERAQFYFVHSFYPDTEDNKSVVAWTDYGITFASVIAKGNIVATQFHPEKSGREGLKILSNFNKWDGTE
ncbi:MAG TPA: imidazole glycerol phosphate synthase subunit HisH [Deltaproteobacteria bacterium]|nr:MAG: imidazole glycerol phosphate synthase subunit HisH [Deltaproteobacteria bacterium]HDM32741.1 imidazole glycerol phosphate synthase subunit HisH [Deltaproteobacteria bacterium]